MNSIRALVRASSPLAAMNNNRVLISLRELAAEAAIGLMIFNGYQWLDFKNMRKRLTEKMESHELERQIYDQIAEEYRENARSGRNHKLMWNILQKP